MELLFIRHAEPQWIVDGAGVNDPFLTARGHSQAAALAERLAGVSIHELWVSPAHRSVQTAAPLLAGRSLEAQVCPWLIEVGTPNYVGKTEVEISALYRAARRRPVREWWGGMAGGENTRAFVSRVTGGLQVELGRLGGRTEVVEGIGMWGGLPDAHRVAVVSHAGSSAVMLTHLLGAPQVPWAWERFRLGHSALAEMKTSVIADGLTFGMRSFNDQEHVPMAERTT